MMRNNLRYLGHSTVFPRVASPFAVAVLVPLSSPPPPASVISYVYHPLTQWTKKRLNCFKNQTLEGGSLEIEFDFGLRVELGANGRTGQEWNKLLPYLRSRLGGDCNICESLTSGPSHAIDITREVSVSSEKLFIALIGYAIRDGEDDVIAVGGDGTLHETTEKSAVSHHLLNTNH
ncbi:hypothetical protein HID58_063521 [Brassica napus]|uniref:Uncharacterized protein n=1 Tax=Brassica napus TaxID=3708 RepID=A0ABQ8A5S7_BRANA|nr:hypothetical protein HID58_063521 [Brassica napus]